MVIIEMENGKKIKIELYPEIAPISCENFEKLVKQGFYDGLIFHRVISGFMIQGGCRFSLDIPPYVIAGKEPTRYCGINIIGLRRRGYSNEQIDMIHDTYRTIYANGIIKDGIQEARAKYPGVKEVEYICKFFENSKRGVIR